MVFTSYAVLHFFVDRPFTSRVKKAVSGGASMIDPNIAGALTNVLNAVHGTGWNRRYVPLFCLFVLFMLFFNNNT